MAIAMEAADGSEDGSEEGSDAAPNHTAKDPRRHPQKVCRDAAVLSLSRRQARWPPRRNLLVSSIQGGVWMPSDALPLALVITHKHLEKLGSYARLL